MADIMDGARLPNGSRARMDGGQNAFADMHRGVMPASSYMVDMDRYGWIGGPLAPERGLPWMEQSEDELFAEYEPDDFHRFHETDRTFALVCIFEHKVSGYAASLPRAQLEANFLRDMCRLYGRRQPEGGKPMFFWVIGPKDRPGPWELIRTDLTTGEAVGKWTLSADKRTWFDVYQRSGITAVRSTLHNWMKNRNGRSA